MPYSNYIKLTVFVLWFGVTGSFAQTQDTIPKQTFAVDVAIDYLKFASYLTDSQKKFEGEAGFTVWKIRLSGEYGQAELTPKDAYLNADYFASGSYWRAGVDYRIDINPKNLLFLGFRYAKSAFDQHVTITYDSQIFNPFYEEQKDLSANWYEAVFSSETKVIGGLYLGFKFRIRFMNSYDDPGKAPVYAIPGYGISYNKSQPALNLYLKYRLGF